MDEQIKNYLIKGTLALSSIVLVVSLVGNYIEKNKIKDNIIAVDRSPLLSFRLLEYKENKDGAFFDIVSVDNGEKYTDIFISSVCPKGKEKQPGLIMKLSAVKYLHTYDSTESYRFDRAYDYLCTDKDMAKEDEILLNRIKEARERRFKELLQSQKLLQQPSNENNNSNVDSSNGSNTANVNN